MHIGILSSRSPDYHPNKRLMEAAFALGHKTSLIHAKDCLSKIGHGDLGLDVSGLRDRPDVLLPRIGATINEYAITLVRHFQLMGIPVINGFQSILLARNKFLCLQTLAQKGIPVLDSHYVSNLKSFERVVSMLGGYPVVAKTPNSRKGKGVIRINTFATGQFTLSNLPVKQQGLLVQEFVPAQDRRDIRAFVLGDQVIGALEVTPHHADFRSNINLADTAKPTTLNQELEAMAVTATRALGLEISGTDMMVISNGMAKVVEVNYSPGFKGLEASTNKDIASQIIQYVARTHRGTP